VVTLGGIIGAGGLGAPLQTGITTGNDLLILVTGCWVAFLAVSMDAATGAVARLLSARYGGIP
jgi:osmoprotectant transport system permease protein